MTDFNPLLCPAQFAKWLEKATPEEREKHAAIWTKRAMAAFIVMKGVRELQSAVKGMDQDCGITDRLNEQIEEVFSIARELHDYDPTSD